MADPLSTAGTAVGIVSLGLQVSQGLITYYSHFKAYDAEIAYLVRKSESLQGLLQALESPLRKAEDGNGSVSAQVRNAVLACEAGLKRLLAAVQTYGNLAIPATQDDKLRALKKRVLYPFKRSSLQDLSFTLEELVGNLQLALQILTLEISQNHKDATISIAETTSNGARDIVTHFDVISNKLESRLDQLTSSIQTAQSRSLLHREPAVLASLCQKQQELRHDSKMILQTRSRQRKFPSHRGSSLCSCPSHPQTTESRFDCYRFSSSWSQTTRHLPQCPRSRYSQHRVDTIEAKYTYYTKVLGYSIVATFSATRGAGAFSISPHFMLRAVVPRDSPAFRLLYVGAEISERFSSSVDHANWIIQELDVLFRKGKASPTDADPHGTTLLHMATRTLSSWQYCSPKADYKMIQATGHLLDGILSFGADPLERDYLNRTIMDILLLQTYSLTGDYHDLLVRLFDCGLAIENIRVLGGTSHDSSTMSLVQNTMNRLTEEQRIGILELPDFLKAICTQDEAAMEQAFQRSPDSVNQRYTDDLTPLHLSISCLPSLSFLLAHNADTGSYDSLGSTPLYHACVSNYVSSISSLLDYDSPMGSISDQNACLGHICRSNDVALQNVFISHLVNRRKRLLELALAKLPQFELEMLSLKEDRVLDAQAASVASALLQHNIEIDPALMPSIDKSKTTVYHILWLGLHMAKNLYESGFRDIDEMDKHGSTPFESRIFNSWNYLESLETLQWLTAQGVDAYRKYPQGGRTALHALGAKMGRSFGHVIMADYHKKPLKVQQAKIAGSFLEDEVVDGCDCACSRDGCRIITSALSDNWNMYTYIQDSTGKYCRNDRRLRACLSILKLVEASIPERPWIPHEVLRVMTFEWLELTHTCHEDPESTYYRPREQLTYEEIQEIHDEEEGLLQEHKNLVAEFEAKYAELGLPITAFMEEYWVPRMKQVLNPSNECSLEEERSRMREFGIMVQERDRIEELDDDAVAGDDDEGKYEDEDGNAEEDSGSEDFHDCEDIASVG